MSINLAFKETVRGRIQPTQTNLSLVTGRSIDRRWRQWVLQIVTLLSLQDGSVLDAVMMWKKNVDKVRRSLACSLLHRQVSARRQGASGGWQQLEQWLWWQ